MLQGADEGFCFGRFGRVLFVFALSGHGRSIAGTGFDQPWRSLVPVGTRWHVHSPVGNQVKLSYVGLHLAVAIDGRLRLAMTIHAG